MSKVKIAFVGCGGFMGAHSRRLATHPDVELVAMVDVTEEIAAGFIDRTLKDYVPRPPIFTDHAKMYRQIKPDAVLIATPHTTHFDLAMQALAADCHVFIEKPMVTSADQAYVLAQRAKETGKIVVIGYNTPCFPEYLYLRELIRAKELGKLELVTGYLSQNWLKNTVGKWRQEPGLSGGGQAYDSGAHLLNSLCWTVESSIAEVFAFIDNHGSKVDINSTLSIRFENGVLASIAVGGNCAANGTFMNHIFENGRVETDPCGWGDAWINVWKGKDKLKYPPITGVSQTPDDNFIDAILGRAEPRTTPRNGIMQSELMDAIYESARTGKPAKPQTR